MIRKVYPFLLLYCLFFIAGAWLILTYTKAQLLLAVNGHFFALGDAIMPYWTDWGDGGAAIGVVVLLIVFARWRYGSAEAGRFGLLGGLVFAIPSLLSLFIKTRFFNNEPRPVTYFAATPEVLHHVAGVELWKVDSFPSGHTITAFSMALLMVYLFVGGPRRGAAFAEGAIKPGSRPAWLLSIALFIWACSVGYSRMYLAQHFFRDVYWGALIGVVSAMGSIWLGEALWRLLRSQSPARNDRPDGN